MKHAYTTEEGEGERSVMVYVRYDIYDVYDVCGTSLLFNWK